MILSDDHLSELIFSCELADKRANRKEIKLDTGEIVASTEEIRALAQEVRRLRNIVSTLTKRREQTDGR